jgi:3-carboxy-cis,cis-muconate cycloisomerase
VRPSSSTSDASGGLFGGILQRGRVRALTDDAAWLAAMVEVEVALVRALAWVGVVSAHDAEAVARACNAATFDIDEIGQEAAATGTPVMPLVMRIRSLVDGTAAEAVHRGATSQDVLDTALMLVASRALDVIDEDVRGCADAAASLARRHRDTATVGRTLLQQALPTTFGLKAAGWMTGLDRAAAGLDRVRGSCLVVQLGGAVGTLEAFGEDAPAVLAAFADELGMPAPTISWHTERTRVGELAAALGIACGAIAKPARDIVLLAQTEVGEVREGVAGRGASSAMAHKRNPVAAISALASAQRTPGAVATILASMTHEHERAAGSWHTEWLPMRDLLVATGSAAAWLRDGLAHLEVDEAAMRRNLERLLATVGIDAGSSAGSAARLVDRALADHETARSGA